MYNTHYFMELRIFCAEGVLNNWIALANFKPTRKIVEPDLYLF